MRTAGCVLLMVLLSACSGGDNTGAADRPAPSSSASPSTADPSTPKQAGEEPANPAESATCAEVNNGIGAFNRSDFTGTVALFEKAIPLAEARDAAIDDDGSADLLEAVRYYAGLAPEDYLEASGGSPEFEKYKQITLGQCKPPPPAGPGSGEDDGPAVEA